MNINGMHLPACKQPNLGRIDFDGVWPLSDGGSFEKHTSYQPFPDTKVYNPRPSSCKLPTNDHTKTTTALQSPDGANAPDIPAVTFDDIGGQPKAKEKLMRLALVLKNPSLYAKRGIAIPRGAVLYGPPGNGKTLLAKALANHCRAHFYLASSSSLTSMWYGEQERNIDALFHEARRTGGIIFFDEAEDIAQNRANPRAHEASKKAVAALNRNMDGFETNDRVVVMFATNRLQDLDEAVIRPERIDYWIEVPNPAAAGRKEILGICMQKAERTSGTQQFAHPVDGEKISEFMDGLSGADISRVVKNALEEKVWDEEGGKEFTLVSTEDIVRHVAFFKRERKKNGGENDGENDGQSVNTGQYL